jgi:type IV secretion system protein VirD4
MVILDIKKSENFSASKAASEALSYSDKGNKIPGYLPLYKFDPADPDNSVIYNPLEFLPKSLDRLWAAAGRMAEWLCVPSTGADTYFDDRARQWTRGLVAIMATLSKDKPEPANVGQIADFVFGDTGEQNDFLANAALLDATPLANVAKNILSTSERERSATMNTIARSLEPWQDPIIRRLTSGKSTWSSLNLLQPEKIGASYTVCESRWDEAIALNACYTSAEGEDWFPRLFICMPAGDVRAATSVVRVFIGQHTDSLMEREHSRDDPPIIFMLDEFPQLGRMESIMRGVEMGRSAGLKFWFFAQDLQQIGRSYKPEDEAVILGSCAVQCFMNISTPETAHTVSQRLGSTRGVFSQTTRPRVPPEELLNSPEWKNKILCLRRQDEPLVLEKRMFKDM